MHTQEIILKRTMPQKRNIDNNIEFILKRALKISKKHGWSFNKTEKNQFLDKGNWHYIVKYFFEKKGKNDQLENQWNEIQEIMIKTGSDQKFNKYPWVVIDSEPLQPEIKTIPNGVHHILVADKILTIDDLKEKFPTELLNATDEQIELHDAFKGIYGRGPHIRSILSSIWSFVESKGERASHTILWGLPACCKSQILLGLVKLFGEGAFLRLDATSTTRAGLERLIFKTLDQMPPLFICEEIEKADEQALRIWLGGMDGRHEFRKVNNNMCEVKKVYFMSLATANDKDKFDNMMGGRIAGNKYYPGALSSRFVHHLECPRPNAAQMKMILNREIQNYGGKIEWIEPCLELAKILNTDDPRKIIGFLDGHDRLLDYSYQKDQLNIHGIKETNDIKQILQSLGENNLVKS